MLLRYQHVTLFMYLVIMPYIRYIYEMLEEMSSSPAQEIGLFGGGGGLFSGCREQGYGKMDIPKAPWTSSSLKLQGP